MEDPQAGKGGNAEGPLAGGGDTVDLFTSSGNVEVSHRPLSAGSMCHSFSIQKHNSRAPVAAEELEFVPSALGISVRWGPALQP